MYLNLGINNGQRSNLKHYFTGENDKEYYYNLNTLQLNISFKNYYQRIIGIY